jgi:hypothetical protein
MLIKLRNEFYQVQCDAFGKLATDLLDIRPKILRAICPGEEMPVNSAIWLTLSEAGLAKGVDIHWRCRNIQGSSPVEGESMCDVFLEELD